MKQRKKLELPNENVLPQNILKCQKCNGWTKRKSTNSRLRKAGADRYCPRCDKDFEPAAWGPEVKVGKLN